MKNTILKQLRSFSYALSGLWSVLTTEAHMRFHLVMTIYVIFFCAKFFSLSSAQWAVLLLTISAVLITEILNTVLERLCDVVTKEYSKDIKFIKDVSAGAVLLSAICSVAVGICLLLRVDVLRYILHYYTTNIFALTVLIITIVIGVLFIAIKPEKYMSYFKSNKDEIKENTEKD